MADNVLFTPLRALDANNEPIAGARAYFFRTGTSTLETVYQDTSATTPHSSPVLADSNGVFPPVYSNGAYVLRCIIRDTDEVEVSDIDPVWTTPLAASAASSISFSATAAIAQDNVQDAIEQVQANWFGAKTGVDDGLISGTAGANGNLGVFNADGDLVEGPRYGTSGANRLLQLNGSGELPAVDGSNLTGLAEPGMRFIASQDASGDASITFTGLAQALYDSYLVVLGGVIPATDNVHFWMRTSTDDGSSYDSGASDYQYRVVADIFATTAANANSTGAAAIQLTGLHELGSAAGEYGFHAEIRIIMPHLATHTHVRWGGSYMDSDGRFNCITGASGVREAAADVDAIQFLMESGNIESGTFTLYGLRNSA